MNNVGCFAGSGCTVNVTQGGADICWSLNGYITGNTTCSVKDIGFCQGINQTAYTSLAKQAGYADVSCKTSRAPPKMTVGLSLLFLGLLAGLSNAY